LNIGPSPEMIQLPGDYKFEKGKGTPLTEGNDAILFAYGPVMLHEALVAAEYLKKIEFGLKVVNMPWLNYIDSEWLGDIVVDYTKIFVLEDHSNIGGLGDRILNVLVEHHDLGSRSFIKFGLDDYPECGTPLEVLEYHKLDGKSLAARIAGVADINDLIDPSTVAATNYTEEAPQ